MDDWHPEALARIAGRLGIAFTDHAWPRSRIFRTAGGPDIHVVDWGGQGPPAVLLHGGSLTAHTWDYVAIALRADFRLVALDMRGHGGSGWSDDYSIDSYVTDLVAVIDGLEIERHASSVCHWAERWLASSRCAIRTAPKAWRWSM